MHPTPKDKEIKNKIITTARMFKSQLLIRSSPLFSVVQLDLKPTPKPRVLGSYGVATISRLLQIIGLFCKRALYKRRCSVKETCNLQEPTNRSQPIVVI